MSPADMKNRVMVLLDKIEGTLLVLAALSVALYLGELRGAWQSLGVGAVYGPVMLAIDSLFLADLLAKCGCLGVPYISSAWFFIDLVSTLPIMCSLGVLPAGFVGLRMLRELRFIRAMRALRMLRVVQSLRAFSFLTFTAEDSRESRSFGRALYISVVIYAVFFLWGMRWVQARWPIGSPDAHAVEFAVVLASTLGMGLVLVVCRFQIPDLALRQIRGVLNLALPHQVIAHLMVHPDAYNRVLRMPATIIFIDIRGFTQTVERLGADLDVVKGQLERILEAVVAVHHRHDLIVDKFIGDCVMSFRGGDLVSGDPADHAWRVVRAGIESVQAAERLLNCPFNRLKVGGASSEDCLIGTFGTAQRLSYTVLGDAVNLAARLEPACGRTGARNIFCEKTRLLVGDDRNVLWRQVGVLRVAGKVSEVTVYEALEPADAGGGRWLEVFHRGRVEYESRRLLEARALFLEADSLRKGGDGVSQFYLGLCDRFLQAPLPIGWKPIIEMRK